jgi:hypothetical protein
MSTNDVVTALGVLRDVMIKTRRLTLIRNDADSKTPAHE